MNNKFRFIKWTLSIPIILLMFMFSLLISYSRPPVGDDALTQFFGNLSAYLTPDNVILGEQIDSLTKAFNSVKEPYLNWSGRIIGSFLFSFRSIYGDWFIAAASTFVLLGIILSTGALIFGSYKNVFLQPVFLMFGFFAFVYFYFGIYYLLMWTMMAIYGVGALLCLLYIYFIQKVYEKKDVGLTSILFINLFGFLTGITHEIYMFMMFIFLLVLFVQSKEKVKHILCNIGIFLGAVICVFAPGNFVRMKSSHEVSIFDPYIIKLVRSIRWHLHAIMGQKGYLFSTCLILLTLFCIMLFLNRKRVKYLLKESKTLIPYFFVLLSSPFVWAIVSYVPPYGLLLFISFFWIFVFKLLMIMFKDFTDIGIRIKAANKEKHFTLTGTRIIFIVAGFVIILNSLWIVKGVKYNYNWIKSNMATRLEWNRRIAEAQEEGKDFVKVPKFEEKYSNIFNFYNENNKAEEFEKPWYRKYYKLLVIPTGESLIE